MKRTDSETEQKAIQSYLAGNSMAKVGKQLGIDPATVRMILIRNKVPARTVGGIDPIPLLEMAYLYKSGVRVKELAKKYHCSPSAIDQHLQKIGVTQDYKYHNHLLDVDFFLTIDRPLKAYFLGYLLADGYISASTNDVAMMLSSKDKYILLLLAETVHSSNKIYVRRAKDQYTFRLKSAKWKQDLAKYGVVPRKTFIADMPLLSDDMMPHMLRGLIDGDGWVSFKGHQIGLCGTEALVTHVRDYLVLKIDVFPVKVAQVKEHLWQICWGGKDNIRKIGTYLYADKGKFYLQRKFLNFCELNGNTEVTSEIAKGSEAPLSVEGE